VLTEWLVQLAVIFRQQKGNFVILWNWVASVRPLLNGQLRVRGCAILSADGVGHKITHATFGKVIDFGINDMNNMGAAMAPAAADTLRNLFRDTNTKPSDYDLIVTGDLGKLGAELLIDFTRKFWI
jgi:hypothetical protein